MGWIVIDHGCEQSRDNNVTGYMKAITVSRKQHMWCIPVIGQPKAKSISHVIPGVSIPQCQWRKLPLVAYASLKVQRGSTGFVQTVKYCLSGLFRTCKNWIPGFFRTHKPHFQGISRIYSVHKHDCMGLKSAHYQTSYQCSCITVNKPKCFWNLNWPKRWQIAHNILQWISSLFSNTCTGN